MRMRVSVIAALSTALSIGACSGGGKSGGGGREGGPTGWTVLVYVAADNDLEQFALLNLEQMASVGSSTGLTIVAQVDRAPLGKHTPGSHHGASVLNLPAWSTTKRLMVNHNSLQELADIGEINTADPAQLASFIQWGVSTYPAAHYMLVLWDHGGGWTGFGVDETLPGSAATDMMDLPRIRAGVQNGLSAAGLAKFEIIGFDACLMATYEVAEALKASAGYLLASEELEPGHGWDYTVLAGVSSSSAFDLAKKIADGYQAIANTPAWKTGARITLSIIDLSKLAPVETAIARINTDYGNATAMASLVTPLSEQRSAALAFGTNPDPKDATHMVDAGDLMAHASSFGSDATTLRTAVQNAVVYKVNGSAYASASGMSIYFPPEASYYDATRYSVLPGTSDWRAFLSTYYSSAALVATPSFASVSMTALSATGVTLDGVLTSGSLPAISTATLAYGLPGSGGEAWVYGDAVATMTSSSGTDHVVGSWDFTFLHLYQTTPVAHDEYGYASTQALDADTGLIVAPMSYYPTGSGAASDAFRSVVFTISTGAILSDIYYLSTNGTLGQLTPVSGSTIRARVLHLPNGAAWGDSWVDYTNSGAFDPTNPVNLEFISLGSGQPFFSGLRIANAGGAGDWVATDASNPPTKP